MTQPHATALLNRLHAKARLRHLQLLVKLGELGNLHRCAQELHLSQPAVTHLLADLEALLEVPLFERHSRGVRITPYGSILVPVARRMLMALAEGSEAIVGLRRAGDGVVRVAAITGAVSGLLVRAVPAFTAANPGIQVDVREDSQEGALLALSRREVDLMVARHRGPLPTGFGAVPLQPDHFVIACGTHHPLAGRRKRSWAALAKETWLLSPVGSSARAAYDSVMADAQVNPPVSPVVTRVSAMTWSLLASQRLLTLVPHSVVRQLVEAGQLALVEMPEPIPLLPLALVVAQTGVTPATAAFVEFLRHFE